MSGETPRVTVVDEKAAREWVARFERGTARFSARPAMVNLVEVGRKPIKPSDVTLREAYATWKRAYKRFTWTEKEIGASAEVLAATIYALVSNDN